MTLHVDTYLGKGGSSRQPEVHLGGQAVTAGRTTCPQEGLKALDEEAHEVVVAPVAQLVYHLLSS